MLTGIVRPHPLIDGFSQSEGRIAGGTHPWAIGILMDNAGTQHKTGNNTSVITNQKIGGFDIVAWNSIEIAILKCKSTSQDSVCLVDNCQLGARWLSRVDFTLVINTQTGAERERNVLIRKVGGINLKDLLPCPYPF